MAFAKTTPHPESKNKSTEYAGYTLAVLLVVMALTQLFKFEETVPLIEQAGWGGAASVLVSCIVISEVFALPYLLRMRISPLPRAASMVLGWVVVVLWTVVVASAKNVDDTGLLGTIVEVPTSAGIFVIVLLLGLTVWSNSGDVGDVLRKK